MGFYGPRIEIIAKISRHNSRNDIVDDLLYEQMVEEIRRVIGRPEYERINVDMVSDGIDWEPYYDPETRQSNPKWRT